MHRPGPLCGLVLDTSEVKVVTVGLAGLGGQWHPVVHPLKGMHSLEGNIVVWYQSYSDVDLKKRAVTSECCSPLN